jgi:hypothetical protein
MPGGLMQLVNKGAQDNLINGNPSFTHFRTMYKRHTEFAMEHFRLYFNSKNLSLPPSGNATFRAKVEKYAQLLHDCYVCVSLPNIYSPLFHYSYVDPSTPSSIANAIGYEFEWIRNIGYNMINYVAITINGQEIVRHTGEWMKLYAYLKFDANKKAILDNMIGNVTEVYDPANANGRMNQYPHAISSSSTIIAEPSIYARNLQIPLHFWFCETIGSALPLIALQNSDIQIVVELKNMYQLFTVIDTNSLSSTFKQRIVANPATLSMSTFLSPPTYSTYPQPSNPLLTTWNLNPFLECNYIFLCDSEMAHVARNEHAFVITQIDVKEVMGQYGPSNDIELGMRNLDTRVVWISQRSDRARLNDYDNYTNWDNPYIPPLSTSGLLFVTPYYSSGKSQSTSVSQRDILLESSIILSGQERFGYKQTEFFANLQNYKHHTGTTTSQLPGVYVYSFAITHNTDQPTGHINGSQFDKTILRNTYIQPQITSSNPTTTSVCVLKSTANNPKPTIVNPADYTPDQVVTVFQRSSGNTYTYTYTTRVFIESYNFLRIIGGIANVSFST